MTQFVLRRLLLLIPVLFGIVLVTFVIVHSIPGDPCIAMLGERATKAKCEDFRERYGLNDNILVQFARYSGALLVAQEPNDGSASDVAAVAREEIRVIRPLPKTSGR